MSGKILKRVVVAFLLSSMMLVGSPATSHATTPVSMGVVHATPHLTYKPEIVSLSSVTAKLPPLEVRALKIALSKQGDPYRWGATGPRAFDCSGLVYYSYRQLGKHVPRTSGEQQGYASRVYSPRVGDLVFFGWPAYHVGIYVGNGKFLNAPHTGDSVEIDPIWYDGKPSSYGRIN